MGSKPPCLVLTGRYPFWRPETGQGAASRSSTEVLVKGLASTPYRIFCQPQPSICLMAPDDEDISLSLAVGHRLLHSPYYFRFPANRLVLAKAGVLDGSALVCSKMPDWEQGPEPRHTTSLCVVSTIRYCAVRGWPVSPATGDPGRTLSVAGKDLSPIAGGRKDPVSPL